MSIKFDSVSVKERQTVYQGKIVPTVCLIAEVRISDDREMCGFVGEMKIEIGDIEAARKLQSVLEKFLTAEKAS